MTHSDIMPELVNHEGNIVRIEFGYEPVEVEVPSMGDEEPRKKTEYVGYTVRVEQPLEYGKVVSALIRSRYTSDEVEAIVLNGADTQEHEAELDALQEWRKKAKEIAKAVMA